MTICEFPQVIINDIMQMGLVKVSNYCLNLFWIVNDFEFRAFNAETALFRIRPLKTTLRVVGMVLK